MMEKKKGQNGPSEEQMQEMEKQQQERMLTGMKKGIGQMEKGLKMFKNQVAKLVKQGVAVPSDITDNLTKIENIIAAVKNAQTWEDAQAAGIEDMGDLMQDLNDSRQQIEMLTRWPQMKKQMESEVKKLDRELKNAKTITSRLAKKGIDLSAVYATFEAAVNKLKLVKDEAVGLMQTDVEGAMDLVQNDFFGAVQDVWESQRVIQTMSNLGRFTSDFKRGIKDAERQIKELSRKKIDTAELQDLLNQAKAKGEGVLGLMKSATIDEEMIMAELQMLEDLKGQFEEKMNELIGKSPMPTVQATPAAGQLDTRTCNVNGVEMPGSCDLYNK